MVKEASSRFPEFFGNDELLADASCVALNALPAHYIRHGVDLSFHISDVQRENEAKTISDAVESAFLLIRSRRVSTDR